MKEQLTSVSSKVDDLDIPDSFTVEADVTDYEKVEAVTVATNEVFNEVGTDKFDSLDELKDSMTELQDASNKLVSGSGELKDGLDTLLSSSGTLVSGIDQLASGGNTLAGGTGSLVSGANTLNAGLQTASSKVSGTLLPGVKALDLGVSQMQSKLAAKDALPKLTTGVATLDAALNTGKAAEGQPSLVKAAESVNDGVQAAATGASGLKVGVDYIGTSVSSLNDVVSGVASKTGGLVQAANAAYSTLGNVAKESEQEVEISSEKVDVTNVTGTATGMATGTATGNAEISYEGAEKNADAINSLETALGSVDPGSDVAKAINAAIASLKEKQTVSGKVTIDEATMENAKIDNATMASGKATVNTTIKVSNPNVDDALKKLEVLKNGAASIDNAFYGTDLKTGGFNLVGNMNALNTAVNKGTDEQHPSAVAAASAVNEGLKELKAGTPALADGINQVAAGATELNEGVNGKDGLVSQVNSGVLQLKSGTAQLLAGVDGTNGLASGLGQLAAGSSQLVSGASQLNSGAGTLSTGLNTLQSSTGALVSGVEQLDSGADELNSGMIQFNEEGIEKLVSVFDGDVDSLLDKANELLDASKEYKNFSGIADGMDGSVKFIFVSDK